MLVGDSHVGHWALALADLAQSEGWRVDRLTRGGCATFEQKGECRRWTERQWQFIEDLRPDLLILGNPHRGSVENAGLMSTVVRRGQSASTVALLSATPSSNESVPECLAENLDDVVTCEPEWPNTEIIKINERLRDVADRRGAAFLDLVPMMCAEERCPAIYGDVLVYRDRSHITTQFAASRAPVMGAVLQKLAPGAL